MMVSDELKRAIETAQKRHPEEYGPILVAVIDALLPRIIALERLLEEHQWDGEIGVCVECGSPAHRPDCEIAKALEATP